MTELSTADGVHATSRLSLDGEWQFLPGDHPLADVARVADATVGVPGLWEAAGYAGLDGTAWYRRTFDIDDAGGWWTLHVGAVMDEAEVFLNGSRAGSHAGAFTPFDLDVTGLVRTGENEILVRVVDYRSDDPRHRRSAHGKQGWMNDYFPSPPSLYMNFGGIWQSVDIERHGPVCVDDVAVSSDPADFVVDVTLRALDTVDARVTLDVLGRHMTQSVLSSAGGAVRFELGAVDGERWSPASPTLHHVRVAVDVDGVVSHRRYVRFGLRTVTLNDNGLAVNGERIPIRSALVQGFRADELYAEGSDEAIDAELRAARDAGFNMLRLHIKAFDPRYLDRCDEVGMLVHCDIPVAEPIAHGELGATGAVADRCAQTAAEQVRRDRNHPSIVLWSAMNELGVDDLESRRTAGYEAFARRLYRVIAELDRTRPIIENDWPEPDPAFVFESPILTAHWYGRLTAAYLRELAAKTQRWAREDRFLFVSEFGDWGLPALSGGDGMFWEYGKHLRELIAGSHWSGAPEAFVAGTQRYQGLADRLQIEIFRSTPRVIGWCLTELTDVPQEFNGVLDILREPKEAAIAEVARACQPMLPIVVRTSWSAEAGTVLIEDVLVVNDGPGIDGVDLHLRLGASETTRAVGSLEAASVTRIDAVRLEVPDAAGAVELELAVRHGGVVLAENRYSVQVVRLAPVGLRVSTVGSPVLDAALVREGAVVGDPQHCDLLVVGEAVLDEAVAAVVRERLRGGGATLVLAQPAEAASLFPMHAEMTDLATEWGSTPFVFTTGAVGLPSLPRETVLTTEILEVAPEAVLTSVGGLAKVVVGVLKPPPGAVVGAVVGRSDVAEGVLTFCQLPLTDAASRSDPLARALLADVLRLGVDGGGG
jgi:hypothetical protein